MKSIYLSKSSNESPIRGVHFDVRMSNDVFCMLNYFEND